jgi:hypothetical protein
VTDAKLLDRGNLLPHFEVRTLAGGVFRYAAIWQRKNLVLVCVPGSAPDDRYVVELTARVPDFRERDTEFVITQDAVAGVSPRGMLIADKWGEIVHVAACPEPAGLPDAAELLEWAEYVQRRCPECEGEAK